MGKNAKSSGVRGDHPPKAGKKKSYIPPPAPNPENRGAREQGMQQFTAKQFPAPLPSEKGSWDAAMDALCAHFRVKRIRNNQDKDIGIRYDSDRKHLIYPPNRREEV